MNNLSSYCGLTDSRMRASDIDLPVNVLLTWHSVRIPDEIHIERKRNARGNKRRFLVLLTIMAQMDLSS